MLGMTCVAVLPISIHAPREGCDRMRHEQYVVHVISIHAPREGCDLDEPMTNGWNPNFNPRTP